MEEPKPTKPKINIRVGNPKQKGRRSAPKAEERQTGKVELYAYTFKDANLGSFQVLNSANAWWLDSVKVQKLVDAYKLDYNDEEARFYAGVSRDQLEYFQKLHPDFYGIKHACKQNLGTFAKKHFAEDVEKNKNGAPLVYLRMRRKDEGYSERVENTGANGRDLFDGLTQEIRDLGEELRKENGDENKETKHSSTDAPTDTDAGPDWSGDDAEATEDKSETSEVSS